MTFPGFTNEAHEAFVWGAASAFASDALHTACDEDETLDRPSHIDVDYWDSHNLPMSAVALAGELWSGIETSSKSGSLYSIMSVIAEDNGESWAGDDPCNVTPFDIAKFGWYAAMQAMGHGVGIDDHWDVTPGFVKIPHVPSDAVDGTIAHALFSGELR